MSFLRPERLRTAWLAVGWFGIGMLIWLSVIPNPPSIAPVEQGDKLEHMTAYGLLMWWFAQICVDVRTRRWIAAGLLALGIGLEYVQLWGGVREFSYLDMTADAVGIAVGWLAAPPRLPDVLRRIQTLLA